MAFPVVQRLSGAGYCFSASAPPYTATAGNMALKLLQKQPQRVSKLRDRAMKLRKALKAIGTLFSQCVHLQANICLALACSCVLLADHTQRTSRSATMTSHPWFTSDSLNHVVL